MPEQTKVIAVIFSCSIFSFGAVASTGYLKGTGANGPGTSIEDVETIFYKLNEVVDKRLVVSGEIVKILDSRAWIIESGGVYNNEIVVVASNNVQKRDLASRKVGQRVKVVGYVRKASVAQISKDLQWDISSSLAKDLAKGSVWFAADLMIPVLH